MGFDLTLMEQALRIKTESGALDAADFLAEKGFNYEFALVALVGLRKAQIHYGVSIESGIPKKRGAS
jgi:hypothetical protein